MPEEGAAAGPQAAPAAADATDKGIGAHAVKRHLVSASLWSFLATAGGQATSFGIFAILARLLGPRDFGVVAFAALFIDLSRGVMLGGIPEALIQRRVWSDAAANTAFWLNIIGAVALSGLAAVGVLAAGGLGWNVAPTGWVLAALSATLVLDALRAVQEAWLRRNFDYRLLAWRTVYATLIGGAAGVAAAMAGWGVWALVTNRVVVSAAQTLILWRASSYRPRFTFTAAEVRPLLSFSLQVLGSRFVGQLNGRLPDFVIGSVAGPAALGLYRVGSRSLNFLTQTLMAPLQTTTLSAFARLRDPPAIARAYVRFTQFAAAVAFPMFFGAAAIASDFMRVCFGEKWLVSAPIMSALSLSVVPAALLYVFHPALQAVGRPRRGISAEAVRLGVGAVLVSGLALLGPLAAAFGDSARRYASVPRSLQILKEEVGVTPASLLKSISVPLACALLEAGVVVALQQTVLAPLQPAPRLIICCAVGATTYLVLLGTFGRHFLGDMLLSMSHGLPAGARAPIGKLLQRLRGSGPAP